MQNELDEKAKHLLAERGVDPAAFKFVLRTGSKADVGYWLGKRRVWLAVLPDRVLLFAPGKRPYFEPVPLADLNESRYNHVTGEVMFAPHAEKSVALRMAPDAAHRVLELLGCDPASALN